VSSQPVGPSYYADFSGLEGLKKGVKADEPAAIRAAAQQFESLFTNMMLKSMREAKLGQGLGESQESDLYQDMYDQQMSLKMAQGKGIGLADMLVQQLTRNGAAKAAAGSTAAPAPLSGQHRQHRQPAPTRRRMPIASASSKLSSPTPSRRPASSACPPTR
jgi:flagellar protein FlgJ